MRIIQEEKYNTLYGWLYFYFSLWSQFVCLFEEVLTHEDIGNIVEPFCYIIYDEEYSVLTLISFGRPSASLSIAIWTF